MSYSCALISEATNTLHLLLLIPHIDCTRNIERNIKREYNKLNDKQQDFDTYLMQ